MFTTLAQNPQFTSPELDWNTFQQQMLNPYVANGGWGEMIGSDGRGAWSGQLGLDPGGRYAVGIKGLDRDSFFRGAMNPNLDDMGLPTYATNPNGQAEWEAAVQKAIADPNSIFTLQTDRINADGSTSGGKTGSAVEYIRRDGKLVPVAQKDTTNSSWNKDFLTNAAMFAAAAGGGALMGAGQGGGAAIGNGAFLGEGALSGIPAWDAAGTGLGGLAGTGIPAYSQGAGYGTNWGTLADASGASPYTAGGDGAFLGGYGDIAAGGASDPISAYLTTGATEGSTIGNALSGAGGSAGAVGAGTTAGALGTLGNIASGAQKFLGGNSGLLNLGGNLLNSYLGYNASQNAADAQIRSAQEANALAKYMYDTTRTDNMPALQARNSGLTGYQNLLQNPGQITQDPGYQFGLQQGVNAYDNSGAARGMRLSGSQAKALTRFGQDYGQTKFNESLNRYGNLAGLGQTGTSTIAGAGQNYANTAGQNITGAGNAAASGYIGGANAISGGISNLLKGWNEQNLLKQLGIGGP